MNALRTAFVGLLLVLVSSKTTAAQLHGFTEPFRVVDLACDEAGAIAELHVVEGSEIKKGEIVARLDDRMQRIQVELAKHLVNARSSRDAALQALQKRQTIAERVARLVETGNATESELIRAELERSIAEAKFLAAEEDAVTRDIELQRSEVALDRRRVRAPFDGVVSKIHRHQGEFLSPVRPEIVTLVQVDQLLAVFNIPSVDVAEFDISKEFSVLFESGLETIGFVHSIGVQTDAESGTVQLKLRIDNTQKLWRSGEQCFLNY